jgi:DNA-3-methyladenine glycosylase II
MTPAYWQQASAELAQSDPVLAGFVERFAGTALVSRGDPFVTLLRSIVGQQISVKAADSVWGRFLAALPAPAPTAVLGCEPETLRGCGLSVRKVEYVIDLARRFARGRSTSATGRRCVMRRSSPS